MAKIDQPNDSKPDKNHRLTGRDHKVLRYLCDNPFTTGPKMKAKFWPGQENDHCYRRLAVYRKMGIARRIPADARATLGYELTSKGLDLLKRVEADNNLKRARRYRYRNSYTHDALLMDIRDIMTASPIVSGFILEPDIKSLFAKRYGFQKKREERYKVPDGLFQLRTKSKTHIVALELEISPKSKGRYNKMFRQLVLARDYSLVFFVVKDDQLLKLLERALSEARAKDPIVRAWRNAHGFYFALLEEILKERTAALFQGEELAFSLDSLAAAQAGNS